MRYAGLLILAGLAACGSTAGMRLESAECVLPGDGTAVARTASERASARACPFCGSALVALESEDRWCTSHHCPSCGGSVEVYADGSECGSVVVDGRRRVYVSGVRAPELEPAPATVRSTAAAPGRRGATPESKVRRRGRRLRKSARYAASATSTSGTTFLGHPVGRPAYSVTIPYHAVNRPSHSVTLPDHAVNRPSHPVTRPSHSVTLPSHSVTRPSHSVTLPAHAVTRPDHAVNRPSHPVTRPSHPVRRPAHPVVRSRTDGGADRAPSATSRRRYAPPPERSTAPVHRARPARSG